MNIEQLKSLYLKRVTRCNESIKNFKWEGPHLDSLHVERGYYQLFLDHLNQVEMDENTSDGYHTFKELYEYRMLYNAALFTQWSRLGHWDVHKSLLHSDGEKPFDGGWFIVVAELPTGQISNHYPIKDWNMFGIPYRTRANTWDGHTPAQDAQRLRQYLNPAAQDGNDD